MQYYDSLPEIRRRILRGMATTPGLILPGITVFDNHIHLPLQPLYLEHVYRHKVLWKEISDFALGRAEHLKADVVAGVEAAGIPLASSMAFSGNNVAFAYVRKHGYVGHVTNEPLIRGAAVGDKRVFVVEDAIWTGNSLRTAINTITGYGGLVVGAFSIVDMRQLCPEVWARHISESWVPTVFDYCGTYWELLDVAVECGVLTSRHRDLIRRFGEEGWKPDHPDWSELNNLRLADIPGPIL